jgi:chromosome segregation ATPase
VLERSHAEQLAVLRATFEDTLATERASNEAARGSAVAEARRGARDQAAVQLRAEREHHASVRTRMESALAAAKAEIADVRATAAEREAALEERAAQLAIEKEEALRASASARDALAAETHGRQADAARFDRETERVRTEHEAAIAELQREVAGAKAAGDEARGAYADEARERGARERDAHDAALALRATEERFERELSALRAKHEASLKSARDEVDQIASVVEAQERKLRQGEAALAELRAKHSADMARASLVAEERTAAERDARKADAESRARTATEVAARHARELAAVHDEAAAALATRDRAHRDEASRARAEHEATVAKLERDLASVEAARAGLATLHDEELRRATAVVAKSAKRITELEEALSAQRAEIGRRDDAREREHQAALTAMQRDHEGAIAARDARIGQAVRALEDARRAHAEELSARVAAARAESSSQADQAREQALAELASRLSGEHQIALASNRAELDTTLATIREDYAQARTALEARADELSEALTRARQNLDAERRDRLVEEGETSARIDALEAQTAARDEEIERLRRANEESQAEVPELEAEIVVLRSELMSVRRQLDQHVMDAEASRRQLERDGRLLGKAKAALAELVSRIEGEAAPEGDGEG